MIDPPDFVEHPSSVTVESVGGLKEPSPTFLHRFDGIRQVTGV